jgi:hypothetical protein
MGAPQYEQAGADVAGSGTTNTIPRWTGASTLGDSGLLDDGTQIYTTTRNVGLGTATPQFRLDVVAQSTAPGIRIQTANANTSPSLNAEPGLNLINTNSGAGVYTSITNRDSAANPNSQINFINVNQSGSGAINFVTRDSVTGFGERVRIDASGNVGIGTASPTANRSLTTAADIDVFGVRVGRGNGSEVSNTALGRASLGSIITGDSCTAVGSLALQSVTGSRNTAVGYAALNSLGSNTDNTAVGASAIAYNTGSRNTAIGRNALQGAVGFSTGSDHVCIGDSAGDSITTGSSNIVIGSNADVAAATDSNQLVLGSVGNYVATNGAATTYYATAGASLGYIQVRLNGANVKIQVFAP